LDKHELELIKRVIDRLEHLSVDSIYAHRASGLRGSLLRYQVQIETCEQMSQEDLARLDQLLNYGFEILELAGKGIRVKR
jgi:hypothetical protein